MRGRRMTLGNVHEQDLQQSSGPAPVGEAPRRIDALVCLEEVLHRVAYDAAGHGVQDEVVGQGRHEELFDMQVGEDAAIDVEPVVLNDFCSRPLGVRVIGQNRRATTDGAKSNHVAKAVRRRGQMQMA